MGGRGDVGVGLGSPTAPYELPEGGAELRRARQGAVPGRHPDPELQEAGGPLPGDGLGDHAEPGIDPHERRPGRGSATAVVRLPSSGS